MQDAVSKFGLERLKEGVQIVCRCGLQVDCCRKAVSASGVGREHSDAVDEFAAKDREWFEEQLDIRWRECRRLQQDAVGARWDTSDLYLDDTVLKLHLDLLTWEFSGRVKDGESASAWSRVDCQACFGPDVADVFVSGGVREVPGDDVVARGT